MHESRLSIELQALLRAQRVACLATINGDATPAASMVPFAIDPLHGCVVSHVSGLAAHTANLQERPAVSLLVMKAELSGEPVHALPRVTFNGLAAVLQAGSRQWQAARDSYIARFPEAEFMTQLGDFRFVSIDVKGASQVAGFGAARSIDMIELKQVLTATS